MIDTKVLKFALLGGLGCLVARGAGEGWMAATPPAAGWAVPDLVSEPGKMDAPQGAPSPPR